MVAETVVHTSMILRLLTTLHMKVLVVTETLVAVQARILTTLHMKLLVVTDTPHSSDYGTHAHYCYARAAVINEVRRGVVCQLYKERATFLLGRGSLCTALAQSLIDHRHPQTFSRCRGAELKTTTISLRCP